MGDSAVFFSDELGVLADRLAEHLFPPGSQPFKKRLVIVPSQATKVFIQRRWARRSDLGIAAGVEFIELQIAASMLASAAGKILPSSLELSVHLFHTSSRLLNEGCPAISDLVRYLEGKKDRLFPLCEQLASLFLDYGRYGEDHLESWLKEGGWQAKLWQTVFGNTVWTYPLELFAAGSTWGAPECTPVHVFGFFSLPPAFARFFKSQAAFFYFFSPCKQFWGDFVSDKAHAREALFFQKKGVAERELADFDHYIEEQHPLLANWGQAGRFIQEVLQTEEMPGGENFSEKEPRSRLHLVQKSILDLDMTPCHAEHDDSLQILSVPSRLREMEALLDSIKDILQRHAGDEEPLTPGDILVLAPDITLYVPYIQAFFGSKSSELSYAISGIERIRTSPLAESFRNLLGLLEERFDAKTLLTLFQSRAFSKSQGWEENDLVQIARWVEKAGITWGYDGAQRARITHALQPLEERGSFSFGFDRLLFGLVCSPLEESLPSPLPILDWTDSDLFGQLAKVVEDLQRDVAFQASEETRTLSEWTLWTGQLFDRYFCSEEENFLQAALIRLNRSCRRQQPLLQFQDFCRIVDDILGRRSGQMPNADLQAVRFASLAEGEVLPARMICLLGMEEGAYPRAEKMTSLGEISIFKPSTSACDRYLFLEACMKAQEFFRISYVNRSPEEKVELMPSIVVQELAGWLKKFFVLPSSPITAIPPLAISKEALEQFPYFSSSRYQAAQLYYGVRSHPPIAALEIPKELPPDAWPEEEEIRIEDLYDCLRNPLAFYFSKVLKFHLRKEDEEDFAEEEFCIASWDMLPLARQSLSAPLEEVVATAKQRGEFPMGEFKQVARAMLAKKSKELREQFNLFNIAPHECFTAILSRCCEKEEPISSGKLLLPAWKIAYGDRIFFVTGQIKDLSPQGLVCYGDDKPAELFPYWPHYLVLAGHSSLQHIPAALLPVDKTNKKKEKFAWAPCDPKEEMGKLLLYYQKTQSLLSPFLSKWLPDFFGPFEKMEKTMREDKNLHAKWLIEQQGVLHAKALCEIWQPYLQKAFHTFLTTFEEECEDI